MLFLLPFALLGLVILLSSAIFLHLRSNGNMLPEQDTGSFGGWTILCVVLATSQSVLIVTYYDYFALQLLLIPLIILWGVSGFAAITLIVVMPRNSSDENVLPDRKIFGLVAGIPLIVFVLFGIYYSPSMENNAQALIQGPVIREGQLEAVSERQFRRIGWVTIDGERYTLARSRWVTQPIASTIVFVTDPASSAAFPPMDIAYSWLGWLYIGLTLAVWLVTLGFMLRVLQPFL